MSIDEAGNIDRNETPHERIDILADRLLAMELAVAEIKPALKNCNVGSEDKYKLEQKFIVRFLKQQGYTVDNDSLFETLRNYCSYCIVGEINRLKKLNKYITLAE